jgi:predicted  nucleic acid-binding Zn-ribbon protein
MPMDNVTLENTQQSISSRDAKSVASVMVNGKWVNLSDTLEQANVKSDVGTVAKQVAAQQEVVSNAASTADSAVAYANDAIEKSRVNSQAIDDINSAVSDAASAAAVARSDGLRAWNAAQSNVNLIDLNYASASVAISSARTEAIAAADEAKTSASAAQSDIVVVKSSVAAVQADVTATRSDVAVAKSDIADTKTTLEQTASGLNSKISGVATSLADTTSALSDAKTSLASDVADAKKLANTAQATADSAIKSAGENANALNSQANALSDAKKAIDSDVASAKGLANAAQATADNAIKSASSVADDLTAVASQAKANANGITKVTSDVGLLQTTVANNTGDISTIQETAKQIQQSVSDNAGNITVAKQTADSAVAVASDAKSNATVAIQTASQASITAKNSSGQAASAVITANGAMTTASDAKSNATVAVQTASGASLTATNANSDATVAKQTASEAKVQASNAESDFAQLSIRANKIEANVADNSGAIASVQQTANGLTTTVGKVDDRVKKIEDTTNWMTKTGPLDMDTLTTTQNIYYRDTNLKNADGEVGWAYIQVVSTGERVTQTVWHDRSSIQHTRTGAIDGSTYDWDAWNTVATNAQVVQVKQTVDGIATTINDPKTGLNATYQTASGNSTTISNVQGDVSQLKVSASSASVALSDAAGNISSLQATASELETKYADAAGDISQIKTDAKGMTQTISDAQGDIAKLKTRADGFDAEFATANGNISKLQTDASGTTQTLANTKSDVAVLQSRADGLDAKYATAAGDINTLKTNASGFSQTLTNAQGDISTLKSTVSGVQTTLTDAQGNISTLQSDVSGLKKTTSDNAGNIATLQASAKTLTSQMSSAQGDISTLKQTASDFSSKVSGMETSLSNANSKINDITSNGGGRNLLQGTGTASGDVSGGNGTFAQGAFNSYDAVKTNGCWSEHYLDLKSALGRTNAKAGDWVTISVYVKADKQIDTGSLDVYRALGNVDANTNDGHLDPILMPNKPITTQWQQYSWSFQINNVSLQRQNTRVEYNFDTGDNWIYWAGWMLEKGIVAHDWSPAPEDADAKITANTTAINQNKTAIALKADQTTVDKTNGDVQQLQSQLKLQADQISSKVSSSDLDAKGYATQTYTQTQIKQTADSWNANLTKLKNDTQTALTTLSIGVEGVQAQVYNSDGSSKIDQLSNMITAKVSQGDYNSQITQLKNDINLRVSKGDVISQINQEAGGNTLIQVSNGKGSLVLDAANTIITGKAWIPVAAIADLTADQIQAGTLKGIKVDFRDSTGTGMIADGSTLTFDVSNTPAGYLSYNGMPVAELPDGSGGNELAIRYGLSTAIIPADNSGAQATFSKAAQKIAYMIGTSQGKQMLSGLEVHSNNHHWLCAVNSDATCNRFEVDDRNGLNIAWHDKTHFFISDGNAKLYQDNNDSPVATKLEVHGWAWVNGWVEAAGHSQHSALSTKTDLQTIDDDEMLEMVNNTDLASFLFKTDVASGETHRHIGLIIDDVHDVAQYQTPQEFIAPNGASRDDDNMIGALFGAVKALTKRIKILESKVN